MKVKFSFLIVASIFLVFLFSTVAAADESGAEPEFTKESIATIFDEEKEYDNNEVIVEFKRGATAKEKQKALSLIEGTEVASMLNGKFSLVSLPKGTKSETAANQLLGEKIIEFVQPNYRVEKRTYRVIPAIRNSGTCRKSKCQKLGILPKVPPLSRSLLLTEVSKQTTPI
ncbi:hypothetical protein B0H99_104148 [Planomicrobium soli]|uniref:Fervidolysin-like N-terminal prodomain domain-containing protein n=1 Tax=Planomicrobium soli TaxID=1176648 RepID=A0A2P8H388_9BACL|nr:hypothetical protein [Planomicrobium soli]PSL40686.1 hypothetical protein B0H99_104148 [Planomicrobium soli]